MTSRAVLIKSDSFHVSLVFVCVRQWNVNRLVPQPAGRILPLPLLRMKTAGQWSGRGSENEDRG